MQIRLAHFETSMNWGGQELRVIEQTEWLNEHGYPCWIIARPDSAILLEAQKRNLPYFELRVRGSLHPQTLSRLHAFLKENKITHLDCHSNRDAIYGAFIKWLTSIKVIRSRHVTDPIKANDLQRFVWRHGNHGIITTAKKINELLIAQHLTIPKKVFTAPAGVDTKRFTPDLDGSDLRLTLGIPADNIVIANIGMIREDKGQNYYVAACRQLLEQGKAITCIQVGKATEQTKEFEAEVRAACGPWLDNGIYFLGYHDDIERYIALSDLVVIASVATEAQTRLVSQAFLMKKNVIATTVGGLPEMITHEKTGLLYEPCNTKALIDAAQTIIENPILAKEIQENAFEYAKKYMTNEYMMAQMIKFYNAV